MMICPMNERYANEIFTWRYTNPYDFYDMEEDPDTLDELLHGDYFGVTEGKSEELIGFYAYGDACRVTATNSQLYCSDALDFGLGLRPDFTGKGIGMEFVLGGMNFGIEQFGAVRLRLTVADFNKRAIKIYRRAGFASLGALTSARNHVKFQVMEKKFLL